MTLAGLLAAVGVIAAPAHGSGHIVRFGLVPPVSVVFGDCGDAGFVDRRVVFGGHAKPAVMFVPYEDADAVFATGAFDPGFAALPWAG